VLYHFFALLLLVGLVVQRHKSAWNQILNLPDLIFEVPHDLNLAVEDVVLLVQQVVVCWPRLNEVLQRSRQRIVADVLNVAGANLLAFNDFDFVVVARLLNELAHFPN
jgi:hypothetical protein